MAMKCSKQLCLQLNKYSVRNVFPALGINFQNFLSLAHYSSTSEGSSAKLNKAMKAHLEKVVKYEKFIKEQLDEYNLGKKFLANMMGKKEEEMTQKIVDEAIEYLFPSSLYVPKARPMMKPPEELFEKHKKALFDYNGRPFHFLFYTSKPNFAQCLHDAASTIEKLNKLERINKTSPKSLVLSGGRWLTKEELENKVLEKVYNIEYEKFVEVFKRLSEHPFAKVAEDFIKSYWISLQSSVALEVPNNKFIQDGVEHVIIRNAKRKTSFANVTVSYPGTGKIQINNVGLDYFDCFQSREQHPGLNSSPLRKKSAKKLEKQQVDDYM